MFKVGDILIGNERNYYGITNREVPVEVKKVEGDAILVDVLIGEHEGFEDWVRAEEFDYYVEPKSPSMNLLDVFGF